MMVGIGEQRETAILVMAGASLLSAASQSHQVKLKAPRDVAWRSTLLGYETTIYVAVTGMRERSPGKSSCEKPD